MKWPTARQSGELAKSQNGADVSIFRAITPQRANSENWHPVPKSPRKGAFLVN
jgi:hypothetical protein